MNYPRLTFSVQGSAPEPYQIEFRRVGTNLIGTCTCPAEEVGQYCKHRLGLLRGETRGLVSGNPQEVALLPGMLAGTDVEAALAQLAEAEDGFELAKKHLSGCKKALARALNR